MKDNFDLKKFLKESKAIENLNPSLKSINDKESKSLKENSLKSKIREMIINELSPSLDEAAAEDLELKSFAKQLYSFAKREGAQASYIDYSNKDFKDDQLGDMSKVKQLGTRIKDRSKPYVTITIYRGGRAFVSMMGDGVAQLYKDMVAYFKNADFTHYRYFDTKPFSDEKTTPYVEFTVQSKTTGKKGGVMATEADGTDDITFNRGGGATQAVGEEDPYSFLSESDDLHEKDESGLADAAIEDIKKNGKNSEWIKNLPAGMASKLLKKIKDEKNLKEAEKDEDGEEMKDESREERADVDKYEFEKGKEAGEEEGKSGIEDIAADLDGTESDLMGNLMNALKIAKGMDNEKLEVQIGNTLKFFVSTYIDKEENER